MKNRWWRGLGWAAGFFSASAFSLSAVAQTPVARPTQLPAFGRSVAGTDDTTAIVLNPANLAFLPATELRWSSVYLDERARVPYQGHAIGLGLPIPFLSMAAGVRVDILDPPDALASSLARFRSDYWWLTTALAFRAGRSAALGLSYAHAYSDGLRVGGTDAWSFAFTTRPSDYLGMSAAVHAFGGPTSNGGDRLGPSYDLAIAVRPVGTRLVELGLEGKYVAEEGGYWIPRATLGIDVPGLGRLRGEASVSDPFEDARQRAYVAAVTMSLNLNGTQSSFELGAGPVFGSGLGRGTAAHVYENLGVEVAFKGYREPDGANPPAHALRLRLEETPGTREHVALLRKLWSIAEDEPSVAAVVFELRSSPAGSLARAQELRDAILHLRNHGKRVLCHLESGDGSGLYVCAAAHRILVSPGGGLRFAGLRARYFYYRTLLEKLGIRAEFVRSGPHKSAPEAFTRDGASDVAREDKIDLLQQYERLFTAAVASGRRIEPALLRKRIAEGPFLAEEAKAAGLVDALAYDDEIERAVSELVGGNVKLIDDDRARTAPRHFGRARGVALVYVDGDLVDGRSSVIPFLGMRLVGSYTIAESLKKAREDPSIGAVVLRVESGGGSALAADVLFREVELTARVKPVVVSMGGSAASAAYYLAAPATRIYANPLTITGSIGVFVGKADVAELLRRIGVTIEAYKTTPRADADALYRPFTPEEKAELERKVQKLYRQFLTRVATGRSQALGRTMSVEEVDKVGQGRVFTGEQALGHQLIDELGGLRQALAKARELAGLPMHAPVTELPPVETTLLGRLLGIEGLHAELPAGLPGELADVARALAPFAVHAPDEPLARIEIVSVDP